MLTYRTYKGDQDLKDVQALFSAELSEPYQIWTYRFFSEPYPELTIFCEDDGKMVGCCMAMLEPGKTKPGETSKLCGYIGMISTVQEYKRRGIGSHLYHMAEEKMREMGATVISLETETDNAGAIAFYEMLGFRKTREFRNFYMNGKGAVRMRKWLTEDLEQDGLTDSEGRLLF